MDRALTLLSPAITSITYDGGYVTLEGTGIANSEHTLEASPDLGPDSFDLLIHVTPGIDGIWMHQDDAALFDQRFYRLTLP